MKLFCVLVFVFARAAASNYCSRPNLDCYGHDITSFTGNAAACKQACDNNAACKSIQSWKNICWLKNYACQNSELNPLLGANDFVKYNGICSLSAYARPKNKYCHRDQLDCWGHDLVHIGGTSGPAQCQYLCDYQPNCVSIQILDDGNCWLKNYRCSNSELNPLQTGNDYVKVSIFASCSPYTVPKQKYCYRNNMDCWGHDIVYVGWVSSFAQCQLLCNWNSNCRSIQVKDNNCWLKNYVCSNNELNWLPGYSDQVKVATNGDCSYYQPTRKYQYCERAGKDCWGHDIMSIQASTINLCQDACSYKDACVSIQYLGTTCWLKNYQCRYNQLNNLNGGHDRIKILKTQKCSVALANLYP